MYIYIYIYISQFCVPLFELSDYRFFKKTFFYLKPVIFQFVQKPS